MKISQVTKIIILLAMSTFLIAQEISFTEQNMAAGVTKNSTIFAADIDKDGFKDIVGNSYSNDDLFWWQNDGTDQTTWAKHTIDNNFNNPQYLVVEDIDADGKMDIIATGSVEAGLVAWWHNDGGSPIGWTREIIRKNFGNAHGIYAKDINGDGNMDIIATASEDNLICWWENNGSYPVNWTEHTIDDKATGSQVVSSYDIDNDGDNDVIAAADDKLILYKNGGGLEPGWTRQIVDLGYSHWVDVADFNNDGLPDIVSSKYMTKNLTWYENNGADSISWSAHKISSDFQYALTFYAADLNNDDNIDLFGNAGGTQLVWFENSGGDNISWTKHIIKNNYRGLWGVYAADMDNDDDKDIISGSNYYGNIKWYENDWNNTGIETENFNEKRSFNLQQNYPNPFNPKTVIGYSLLAAGEVELTIYNSTGNKVKTLFKGRKNAGEYKVEWDGTNYNGEKVSSGIYFYKLTTNNFSETRRLVLLK